MFLPDGLSRSFGGGVFFLVFRLLRSLSPCKNPNKKEGLYKHLICASFCHLVSSPRAQLKVVFPSHLSPTVGCFRNPELWFPGGTESPPYFLSRTNPFSCAYDGKLGSSPFLTFFFFSLVLVDYLIPLFLSPPSCPATFLSCHTELTS